MDLLQIPRVLDAIAFACERHRAQMRKDGRTPYVSHPMRVMTIVSQLFEVDDPEVLAAAVLHDTIEDTDTDRDDILERFGERVASMVVALTKDKRLPEEEREDRYFQGLAGAPVEVKLCKLGDTIDNLIDCVTLDEAHRRKTLTKARRLLSTFEPSFPAQRSSALARLREAISRAEKGP